MMVTRRQVTQGVLVSTPQYIMEHLLCAVASKRVEGKR